MIDERTSRLDTTSDAPSHLDAIKDSFDALAQPGADDVSALRELHTKLTQSLPQLEHRRDFLVALLYKSMIEDVLRNCMEDDYLDYERVLEVVRLLADSWEHAEHIGEQSERQGWYRALHHFAEKYRGLPRFRRPGAYATIEGLQFFIANGKDPLIGPPTEDPQHRGELAG